MAKHNSVDYFGTFLAMAENSREISKRLTQILTDFEVQKLEESLDELHAIEHKGDELKHTLITALAKEFLPPIEREDIMLLADELDDVTDLIEDILLKVHIYDIHDIREDAVEFAKIIEQCCQKLVDMLKLFKAFKRNYGDIKQHIIALNSLEEKGDDLYHKAVRKLFTEETDAKDMLRWTRLYSCFEASCDSCEHVGGLIEQVILKNS